MFFNRSVQKRIRRLLAKDTLLGKRLYLWEINAIQREAMIQFLQEGYSPEAFITFNVSPGLKKAWGVNVFHPEFLNHRSQEDFILCISRYEYHLHKNYLLNSLNLSRRQLYIDYRIPSALKDNFLRMKKRLQAYMERKLRSVERLISLSRVRYLRSCARGFRIYRKLRKTYGPDSPFLFFNYPGLGDACLSSSLLDEYVQKNHMENFVALATGRVCKTVLESYGYQKIHALTDGESERLRQFLRFAGADRLGIKPLVQLANHLDISMRLAATRLSLLDMYAYKIFDYERCPEMKFPKIKHNPEQIRELFERNKLRKGHTVIISPYANSEVGFSPLFWNNLILLLNRLGLDTATMCHPPETPLKGTKALDFLLLWATEVLEYAGYFIGVRSGFCDWTISADCKKIILYPENIYGLDHPFYRIPLGHINSGQPLFKWASFQAMGIDAKATEIRCAYHYTKHLEQLIEKALGEQRNA